MRPGLLLLLAIPVFFLALGANSIWDANEAFYVETPRQMVASGDYINPSFNGEPRLNKPVLTYWVVAGFYQAFGVSVAVERVAIAIGALGILLGAYLIGRAARSPATGVIAALLMASAPRFVFFSRRIAIDIYITLFLTLALACFVMAERSPQHRRRYLLLMYAAIGLGVVTKGPIALAIPALAGLAWLVSEKRLGDLRKLMLPSGALIVLAIVLPWYAALYAQHGWEPIRFFFLDENLGRYATAFTTSRSPFFFLFVLFGDILLPWAPLIVIPMLSAWRRGATDDPAAPIRRLLWWWVAIIVIIFSISASKEDLYILPAIPAAAALVADLLVRSGLGADHRGVRGVMAGIAVMAVAIGVLVAVLFSDGHYALVGALAVAGILTTSGVAAGVLLWRGRHAAAFATLAAGFIAFNYLFVLRVLPDVERLKPVPRLARTLTARASPSAVVGSFNTNVPSLVFYTDRRIIPLTDLDQAVRFLGDHAEAWIVLGPGEWQDLHARVPATCIAERAPQFLAKGSDILRRSPPPDVLLVTRCR